MSDEITQSEKRENFIEGFKTSTAGCRRSCACGLEFWDASNNDWDWEEGEVDALTKDPKAVACFNSVSTLRIEGSEYVIECDCWHKKADQIMRFIDRHAQGVATYLNLEKKRLQRVADQAPTVDPPTP